MTLKIRRVVTDHDPSGRAIVKSDEAVVKAVSARAGHSRLDLWKGADGTIFRMVEYQPGVAPRDHRTETIDYAIVLSGEMEMDVEGTVVKLKKGDVVVQQNTMHNWINRGSEPCVMCYVLIPAKGAKPAVG
jgi:quercetin dioxygenase-like cupin family protein